MKTGKDRSLITERLVKIMLIARVSSIKYGVGHGPTLEEMQPDQAIKISVAITKLPLGRDILKKKKKKKNNKKVKCVFLEIFFSLFFKFLA